MPTKTDKKESRAVGFTSLVERVNDAAMVQAAEDAYRLLGDAVYSSQGIVSNTLKLRRGGEDTALWCGTLDVVPPGFPSIFGRDILVRLVIPTESQAYGKFSSLSGEYDPNNKSILLVLPTTFLPAVEPVPMFGSSYTDLPGRTEASVVLATRLLGGHGLDVRKAFIHEAVHAMDDLRGVDFAQALSGVNAIGDSTYFENPVEVNARFVETLHHFERSMKYGAFGDPEWFGRSFGYTAQEFALLFYDYLSSSASNGYEYSEETRRSILSRAAGEYERLRIKMGV